jgi:hypothetical protein
MAGVPLVKPVVVSSEVIEPDTKKIDDAMALGEGVAVPAQSKSNG